VRRRMNVLAAGVLLPGVLALAGCGLNANAGTGNRPPAATAGRACQVVEYEVVAKTTGTTFDTAGGAQSGDTYTCVLGVTGKTFPDLTVAMTPSTISAVIFIATVRPSGSLDIDQLGVEAYQATLEPKTAADGTVSGPVLELGWISASHRLVFLKYAFPASATDVEAFAPGLIRLAISIDQVLNAAPK
jgi:hypothetical protein